MSNFTAIQGKRERIEDLQRAVRELEEQKGDLGHLRLDSVARAASYWWRGEHQEMFLQELERADHVKRRISEGIDTAVSDYNREIRMLQAEISVLQAIDAKDSLRP